MAWGELTSCRAGDEIEGLSLGKQAHTGEGREGAEGLWEAYLVFWHVC